MKLLIFSFKKVGSALFIIIQYIVIIVFCSHLGSYLLSEVIYHPTPQEIADTHVTPKFQNRAEEIRSGFSTFGAIAGGILGIPVTIFLRILLNKKY